MNKNYSVLMSVYAQERTQYLREAIDSMLSQTIMPSEFVIVKDGNLTKELDSLIEQYQKEYKDLFRIIEIQENVGLGCALAIGIEACKNEYIARIDSDDIATPERCEKEIKMLNENSQIDVVGSITAEFNEKVSNVICYHKVPENNSQIYQFSKKRNPCIHSSIMMKKSKVISAGNYRNYLYFEDYDLWIRMMKKGYKFYNIQEILVYMRTDKNFYKRRGGLNYLKRMLKFKTEQYKNGFYSKKDYIITMGSHFIVCLLPNRLRKIIYLKFLRKKEIE